MFEISLPLASPAVYQRHHRLLSLNLEFLFKSAENGLLTARETGTWLHLIVCLDFITTPELTLPVNRFPPPEFRLSTFSHFCHTTLTQPCCPRTSSSNGDAEVQSTKSTRHRCVSLVLLVGSPYIYLKLVLYWPLAAFDPSLSRRLG